MTRALPRTNFNSSRLIRFLAGLSLVDAAESQQAFAARLGEWLDFADAITLHAAHNVSAASVTTATSAATQAGGPSLAAASATLAADFARSRANLVSAITKSWSANAGETRLKWPTPPADTRLETAAPTSAPAFPFEPYHRFYLAHQRDMESNVRPLRAKVRQVLSKASPALRQLAALDAALDEILGVRERQLLATLPALLERRFGRLLKAHQEALLAFGPADEAARGLQPGGWLAGFGKELQGALLAELDVRLQPVVGLIEAFSHEADKQ